MKYYYRVYTQTGKVEGVKCKDLNVALDSMKFLVWFGKDLGDGTETGDIYIDKCANTKKGEKVLERYTYRGGKRIDKKKRD